MRQAISFLLLLGLLLAGCARGGAQGTPVAAGPLVVIDSPPSGTRIPTGREVEIQVTAVDEAALVQRIELLVDGELVADERTPLEAGQASFTVLKRWVPVAPGEAHVIVYAYNAQGQRSQPASIILQVEGEPLQPPVTITRTSEPLPTPTALPPTPTPAPTVQGIPGTVTAAIGLNVRAGPSVDAARIGGVNLNESVTAIARDASGAWARIRFGPDGQEGWVSAQFVSWQGDFQSLPTLP